MNKRIEELAHSAWVDNHHLDSCGYVDLHKFAQLIVKECAKIAEKTTFDCEGVSFEIDSKLFEHFGIKE
jgi:hypothetical protein